MKNRVNSGVTVLLFVLLTAALTACGGGIISQSLFFIKRVSVDSFGTQADSDSNNPSINSDGRYVAFRSFAGNLVAGDTNGQSDIFAHDRLTGATIRVSVNSSGVEAVSGSNNPSISPDGRYIAFQSGASNLVGGDTNGYDDIFVHDIQTGLTTRASVDTAGTQADGGSNNPSISQDGRYVAFWSFATNLVAGDTNGQFDVFVRDRVAGLTTRVSVDSAGTQADSFSTNPSISSAGRYVAFQSSASNLVAGDANGFDDVFVRDTLAGVTTRVSVDSAGTQGNNVSNNPSISADGRYVAFRSSASNLVAGDANGLDDIFVHDRDTSTTTLVSVDSAGTQADGGSNNPSISADGRYIVFRSGATNLVAGDTNGLDDIFVYDRDTSATTLVSINSAAVPANDDSINPIISSDGRYVAFESGASNLVNGDTLGFDDIFLVLKK